MYASFDSLLMQISLSFVTWLLTLMITDRIGLHSVFFTISKIIIADNIYLTYYNCD